MSSHTHTERCYKTTFGGVYVTSYRYKIGRSFAVRKTARGIELKTASREWKVQASSAHHAPAMHTLLGVLSLGRLGTEITTMPLEGQTATAHSSGPKYTKRSVPRGTSVGRAPTGRRRTTPTA